MGANKKDAKQRGTKKPVRCRSTWGRDGGAEGKEAQFGVLCPQCSAHFTQDKGFPQTLGELEEGPGSRYGGHVPSPTKGYGNASSV